MNFSFVSAVNDDEVLRSCLLSSPDASAFGELILQRGYDRAATAYNEAIEKAQHDVVVLLHQDIYLPEGWVSQVAASIQQLATAKQDWAVLGLYGMTAEGAYCGHLYCVANGSVLGAPLESPQEVVSLDEVVLILRKSSGLRFDEDLPGYHFYGTDLCLQARQLHYKVFAVPGFCLHNANAYGMFPRSFWRGYKYMRHKWKHCLPVRTPCLEIRQSPLYPITCRMRRFYGLKKSRRPLARRVADPARLYAQLAAADPGVPLIAHSISHEACVTE